MVYCLAFGADVVFLFFTTKYNFQLIHSRDSLYMSNLGFKQRFLQNNFFWILISYLYLTYILLILGGKIKKNRIFYSK